MISKIEQQVMAGVGVIYVARALLSATAFKLYILVSSIWMLGVLVWVARVQENFISALQGGLHQTAVYVLYALTDTTALVQLTLLVAVFALGSLAVDLIRSFSRHSRAY
jgi:hypothetical protein